MAESIFVTIDDAVKTGTGTYKVKVEKFATTSVDGSQDLYLSDGGDITDLTITKMGKDDATPDTFHFDISTFDDDFTVNVVSEGPEDTFIIDNATSYTVNSGIYTINYVGSDGQPHVMTIDPGDASVIVNIICFTPGTHLDTPSGPRLVEELAVGDLVMTLDHGPQPLRWIGRRRIVFSLREDRLKPIRISAGAYDGVTPLRPLLLSPQHRVLLGGAGVANLYDATEVLGPVKGMLGLPGFRKAFGRDSVDYISLIFDQHEIVFAEGMPVESYLPRPYAATFMPDAFVQEISALYPGVFSERSEQIYPSARRLLKVSEVEKLCAKGRVQANIPTEAPALRADGPAH